MRSALCRLLVILPAGIGALPYGGFDLWAAPPTSQPARPGGRHVQFAPGVSIDWRKMHVELDGRVVLRQGLLELFACSPGTREHESIVRVNARPLHIFQALGLIGLEPGRPVTYDPAADRLLPAAGEALVIEVRYNTPQGPQTVNVWDWMTDAKAERVLPRREWLFCGSRFFEGGTFGADLDGTVICVVDFDTALIGLAESHSADNAALWLAANAKRIPPQGTRCTLLIRAATAGLLIECSDQGRFRTHGEWVSKKELLGSLAERLKSEPELTVTIRELLGVPAGLGRQILQTIRRLGVKNIRLEPKPTTTAPSHAP